eukprot:15485322-Alexandrium_andersonii.AAC.1
MVITAATDLTPEVRNRVGQAQQTLRKLKIVIVWSGRALALSVKLRMCEACVKSKLMYGLGTTWPNATLM